VAALSVRVFICCWNAAVSSTITRLISEINESKALASSQICSWVASVGLSSLARSNGLESFLADELSFVVVPVVFGLEESEEVELSLGGYFVASEEDDEEVPLSFAGYFVASEELELEEPLLDEAKFSLAGDFESEPEAEAESFEGYFADKSEVLPLEATIELVELELAEGLLAETMVSLYDDAVLLTLIASSCSLILDFCISDEDLAFEKAQ